MGRSQVFYLLLSSAALAFDVSARGAEDRYSSEAVETVTVRGTGPREENHFHNVQDAALAPRFASFALSTYEWDRFGIESGEPADFARLHLELQQDNADFSRDGSFAVWLTDDVVTEAASLRFDPSKPSGGFAGQLAEGAAVERLGSIDFEVREDGHEEAKVFRLDDAAGSLLRKAVAESEGFRIILAPESDGGGVAARYAGKGNYDVAPPRVVLEVE